MKHIVAFGMLLVALWDAFWDFVIKWTEHGLTEEDKNEMRIW